MKLSIIVVAHNMRREVPRTLQSLNRDYQAGSENIEYEVLVIENGSSEKLASASVRALGSQFQYHYLQDPPPSPAYALNYGARHSSGDILCLLIDGAHLLTPGVFSLGLSAFRAFKNPIVLTRYFYLGPGVQNDSILQGYSKTKEDALLEYINWPRDGYRLFEIGTPLYGGAAKITWFNKVLESNCFFMHRSTFEAIGGADERFDSPGGGFLNMDLYRQAADLPDTQPVLLIGEGSFHQLHGGITTNVTPEERDYKVRQYLEQYIRIRGRPLTPTNKDIFYLGHLPTLHSKIHKRQHSHSELAVTEKSDSSSLSESSPKERLHK